MSTEVNQKGYCQLVFKTMNGIYDTDGLQGYPLSTVRLKYVFNSISELPITQLISWNDENV